MKNFENRMKNYLISTFLTIFQEKKMTISRDKKTNKNGMKNNKKLVFLQYFKREMENE
jgi:hypothetical protein